MSLVTVSKTTKKYSIIQFALEEIPGVIAELQAIQLAGVPVPPPPPPVVITFPNNEIPSRGKVLFASKDWKIDHDKMWHATCSPEIPGKPDVSLYASVTPRATNDLLFKLNGFKAAGFTQSGARDLFDPRQLRTWDGLSWQICQALGIPFDPMALIGKDIEFFDVWNCPAVVPNFYGDNGFQCFGWQFKNDPKANANAGMAVNVHTFKDQGNTMRLWLQSNDWDHHAEDDKSPAIPVGQDYVTRLTTHFDSDPTKGSMKLDFLGKNLQVTGSNCAPNGGCGAYKANYGMAECALISLNTIITLLN